MARGQLLDVAGQQGATQVAHIVPVRQQGYMGEELEIRGRQGRRVAAPGVKIAAAQRRIPTFGTAAV